MSTELLKEIYHSRPFTTRNADEFDLENILDLFIDPTDGLVGPFDFSNSIVKGKMGSGKTMYLRANYAYYLYTIVPCLISDNPIVLPVYIKLSDFQNIELPSEIYSSIIVKIIEEIVSVCIHLKSSEELARLHKGASKVVGLWSTEDSFKKVFNELQRITSDEYVESVARSISAKGSVASSFMSAYAEYSKNVVTEIKKKDKPSFQNIVDACNELIAPFNGKLLILFDEIGSLNANFFKKTPSSDSLFEILMNQLRTLSFVRTKIAVYPNSNSDILRETRYGDIISLEQDITYDEMQYEAFFSKTVSLIERYIEKATGKKISTETLFDISTNDQLIIEHFINASEGNMRRLVFLLDASMNEAYSRNKGEEKVCVQDVLDALYVQGSTMEAQYGNKDVVFLETLSKVCKNRSTYKFTFPKQSSRIGKFANFSAEQNIVNIIQLGKGRQSTIFAFDYAYCIYKDIPTHYVKNTERIEKTRSRKTGEPITRIAQLTEELIIQSALPGKIDGIIDFLSDDKSTGFIVGSDKKQYLFTKNNIIKSDKKRPFFKDSKVRFIASKVSADLLVAFEIEIL